MELYQAKKQLYHKKVVDNREVTMEFALNDLLSQSTINRLNVAVGYFYISGLILIKEKFTEFMDVHQGKLNILMGNETNKMTVDTIDTAYTIAESTDVYLKNSYLSAFQTDIKSLDETDQTFLLKFLEWVEQERIEVKVYTGTANYFHAKSYLCYSKENELIGHSIVGSSNFSKNGLLGNTELNVYSADGFLALNEWFTSVWQSDEVEPFSQELIKVIHRVYPEINNNKRYKPTSETYYDFANIFAKPYFELDDNEIWDTLYAHQRSGILKIQDKMMQFGSAILADGVGLGKTRTTAGVIRLALQSNKELKAVIIADKKLHDQWKSDMDALFIDYSEFKFLNRETFALMKPQQLDELADGYGLMVIDEGHLGFKNRNTTAYRHAEYVYSRANGNMKGLILTATPWNNRREDVINIGSLFLDVENIPANRAYRNYFMFGNRGKAIRKLADDDKAFSEFWEDLFLQRTRKTYGGKSVKYASRTFPAIEVPFEPAKEEIFVNNFERIDALQFPYMDILRFFEEENRGDDLTQGRLKLMLLKRADSSWISFVNSLRSVMTNTEQMVRELEAIEYSDQVVKRIKQYLIDKYEINDILSNNYQVFEKNDDAFIHNHLLEFQIASNKNKRKYVERVTEKIETINKSNAVKTINYLKATAAKDLETINSIIYEVESSFIRKDEKYETICKKVIEERLKGNKVILVSQFRDTVLYYFNKLLSEKELIISDIGIVTGQPSDNKIGNIAYSKTEILERFSPISKKRNDLAGTEKEINILIGTDTISTGQNLQDATILMNLDLPYNPMQLEQRIGRIDRPRQSNTVEEIKIFTFPTYSAIESILKMTQRLAEKMKGIYKDTDFDDFVLPEYKEYMEDLLKEKNTVQASKAMEGMVEATEAKNTFNPGMSSDKHSTAYDEANKRMYDALKEGIKRVQPVCYPHISFSNDASNSIAVLKFIYKDINDEEIKNETVVVDISNLQNSDVSNAEQKLLKAKISSIYSTKEYSEAKAEFKIKDLQPLLYQALKIYVEKYNVENNKALENYNDIADNVAKKAASKIQESIKDPSRRKKIETKVRQEGLSLIHI